MRAYPGQDGSRWKRFGWLVLLWALSVGTLGAVAYLLRLFMHAAGLSR
ncbi:Protein of unknown function [Collimonas sp. OK607]|nr:DUF2474 domain-containing protein [Collimonas sp. OK607]SFB00738.1 Protein of unknown function [Collimonas sp. OK607]